MGMAASQARYLLLTARKTNVEYEGQQINQQRTNLANESAGIFNQMLALKVPTAPSSSDYTKTIYTFNDGNNNCTITKIENLSGDPDYNRVVTYFYTQTVDKGVGVMRNDLGVNNEGTETSPIYWLTNGSTTVNKTKLSQCSEDDKEVEEERQQLIQICKDNPTAQIAKDVGYDSTNQTISNIGGAYMYTNTNGLNYFYSSTDLATAAKSEGKATALTAYYSSSIEEKVYNTCDAYMKTSDTGRYSDIQLENYTTSFNLTATSTTDTAAYNNAVNEYEYQQSIYQKTLSDLNAKTSIIEQEDKTLELKLKQLDTEQEALQTEMESVKKVIDKNIEQTYKTFSS